MLTLNLAAGLTGLALTTPLASNSVEQRLELVYRAGDVDRERLDRTAEAIELRLEEFGRSAISVKVQDGTIAVTLPVADPTDANQVKRIITSNGVEFRGVAEGDVLEAATEWLQAMIDDLEPGESLGAERVHAQPFFDADGKRFVWVPVGAAAAEDDLPYALVEDPAPFTSRDLDRLFVDVDARGFPAAGFEVRADRAEAFGDFTEGLLGRKLAILLSGEVHSMPVLRGRIKDRGIIMGGAQGFTKQELEDLMRVLRVGVPTPLELISERLIESG